MTKIAFIGGGSVGWAPGLVADMALTETLRGADLILHDISASALELMLPAARRIVDRAGGDLHITTTLDRAEALRDADFVILCIAVGGLASMHHDLKIPETYGVRQSVGDTVGPGGLSRGLRNIPLCVQIAREMESLCPHGWLLNLTNPMTTLCRAITRETSIRTIGLCHEVTNVRGHLAALFDVAVDAIEMEVAGINHLPVIPRWSVDGEDGAMRLHSWLDAHGAFSFVGSMALQTPSEVFTDRHAVKFSLFQQMDVLFAAGDRHVAEFFSHILTAENDWGKRYGVHLTTIEQRDAIAAGRRSAALDFEPRKSSEQLTPVMAALLGGPSGQFVVNTPNTGQIDNLPRGAVVECMAYIDRLGVHPLATGALSAAAHAVIAPHVDRQELIVEAGVSGTYRPALQALCTEPLMREIQAVEPMLTELIAANAPFIDASLATGGTARR